jgi:hypothetical protein
MRELTQIIEETLFSSCTKRNLILHISTEKEIIWWPSLEHRIRDISNFLISSQGRNFGLILALKCLSKWTICFRPKSCIILYSLHKLYFVFTVFDNCSTFTKPVVNLSIGTRARYFTFNYLRSYKSFFCLSKSLQIRWPDFRFETDTVHNDCIISWSFWIFIYTEQILFSWLVFKVCCVWPRIRIYGLYQGVFDYVRTWSHYFIFLTNNLLLWSFLLWTKELKNFLI